MIQFRTRTQAVKLEGQDAPVYVRQLTGREVYDWRLERDALKDDPKGGELSAAKLVALTCCDADGVRHFTPEQVFDLPVDVTNGLIDAALTFNGMVPKALEDAKNG